MYFKVTITQRMGDVYDAGYYSNKKETKINSSWSQVRNGSKIKLELMLPDEASIRSKQQKWKDIWKQMSENFSSLMESDEESKLRDARPSTLRDFIIMHDDKVSETFESDVEYTCGVYYAKIESGMTRFRYYYSTIPHIKFCVEDGIRTTGLDPSKYDKIPEDIQAVNELLEIMYNEWYDLVPHPSR